MHSFFIDPSTKCVEKHNETEDKEEAKNREHRHCVSWVVLSKVCRRVFGLSVLVLKGS